MSVNLSNRHTTNLKNYIQGGSEYSYHLSWLTPFHIMCRFFSIGHGYLEYNIEKDSASKWVQREKPVMPD